MEQWQQRVIEEKKALEEKIEKLTEYLDSSDSNTIKIKDFDLLDEQLVVMIQYKNILKERINRFV